MTQKFYTGVGSRETPQYILEFMTELARWMHERDWILRSGGAKGADSAFEKGAGNKKQIFYADDATQEAMEIAGDLHPCWNKLPEYAKKLHGRNAFQVLGKDLNEPSLLLICWTADGCRGHAYRKRITGGTGTAISIADSWGIKIINLRNEEDLNRVSEKTGIKVKKPWETH